MGDESHRGHRGLVEKAVERARGLLEEYDVVVVIPPGSSRIEVVGEVLDRLRSENVAAAAVTYRDHQGVESIKGETARLLSEGARGLKVLVVPRDTASAVRLVKQLREGAKTRDARICVLNLAGVYGEELGKVEEHLRLDYTHVQKELKKLGVEMVPGPGGVSLSLLGRGSSKAVDKIKALSPERTGAIQVLEEFVKKLPYYAPMFLLPALASAISSLLGASLVIFPGVDARGALDVLAKSLLRSLVERKKQDLADLLISFALKSRAAEPHIEDELYEGLVDSIASRWGLTVDEYVSLVKNASGLLKGGAGEDDIRKAIEERLLEHERRLRSLERQLEELEHEARRAGALLGRYRDVDENPYIRVRDQLFYINVGAETRELAVTEVYEEIAARIVESLSSNKLVVIEGSAGSGKSILAHYAVAKTLLATQGDLTRRTVYIVNDLRSDERRLALVRLLNTARELGERVILLYDPVYPELYSGIPVLSGSSPGSELDRISLDLAFLLDASQRWRDVLSVVAVLPTVVYKHVEDFLERCPEGPRGECGERLALFRGGTLSFDEEIRRGLKEFVREVIRAHSGCANVDELADSVSGFGESHALIARHVGLLVRERGCRAEDVRSLIEDARGEARRLVDSIVRVRLGLYAVQAESVREERLKRCATILALRALFVRLASFGEHIATPELMSYLMRYAGMREDEVERNHVWLSVRNEDLVEEALGGVLEEARRRFPDLEVFRRASNASGAVEYVLDKWGDAIWELVDESAGDLGSARRIAYLIGFAPFSLSALFELRSFYESFRGKVAPAIELPEGCGADRLFLVDGRVPTMVALLLLLSTLGGRCSRGMSERACRLLDEITELVERRGLARPHLPYLVGVALISLGSEDCGVEAALTLCKSLGPSASLLDQYMTKLIMSYAYRRVVVAHGMRPLLPLIRLEARVGDAEYAAKYASMWFEQFWDGSEPWEKALLVEVFSDLILFVWARRQSFFEIYVRLVLDLVGELRRSDRRLGLLSGAYFLTRLANILVGMGMDKAAERAIGEAERWIEELERDVAGRGELGGDLARYLKARWFGDPRDLLGDHLSYLRETCCLRRARLYCERGIRERRKDLIEKAVEVYDRLASSSRGGCRYYTYRLASLSTRALAVDALGRDLLAELEGLWDEVRRTPCLPDASLVQASLVAALATLNEDWGRVVEGYSFLRRHFRRGWISVDLLVSALRGEVGYDLREVLSTFAIHMDPSLGTRLLPARGEPAGEDPALVEMALRALPPDLRASREIEELDPRDLVNLAAPVDSLGSFILILDSIARRNLRLARLHALKGSKAYRYLFPLFEELHEALAEAERTGRLSDRARMCLLKLYLYHSME